MPGFTLAAGADASIVAAATSGLERDLSGVAQNLADRVLIVVGEIAANAVEHGTSDVILSWRVDAGSVRIDVIGRGPDAPQIRSATLPHDEALRGRGLFLIKTLSTSVEAIRGGVRIRIE